MVPISTHLLYRTVLYSFKISSKWGSVQVSFIGTVYIINFSAFWCRYLLPRCTLVAYWSATVGARGIQQRACSFAEFLEKRIYKWDLILQFSWIESCVLSRVIYTNNAPPHFPPRNIMENIVKRNAGSLSDDVRRSITTNFMFTWHKLSNLIG